jgi:FkbM family methyltransferase
MIIYKIIHFLLSLPKFPGRDFLIVKIPSIFFSTPSHEVLVKLVFGFKMYLNPSVDLTIDKVIFERGVYEYGTLQFIQANLKKGDYFVDVGANIGFLSLASSKIVGINGAVKSFEPVIDTYKILKKNVLINQISTIELFHCALGSRVEEVTIYPEKSNRGGASILNHISKNGEKVNVRRLDDFNFIKVNMIKIDVEGYEFEVLKGSEQTIKKHKPVLIIEYSIDRDNLGDPTEMYSWLLDLDIYHFYKLKRGKERKSKLIKILTPQDLPLHDNIFCIAKN